MNNVSVSLLPCPNPDCRSTDIEPDFAYGELDGSPTYNAGCMVCAMTGPQKGSMQEAAIAWNKVASALAQPSEQPAVLACYDCGLPYADPGFADFVVPDDVWLKISPTGNEGGILCATHMFRRMAALGITCEGRFTSGPCAQHDWKKPASSEQPAKAEQPGDVGKRLDALLNAHSRWCGGFIDNAKWQQERAAFLAALSPSVPAEAVAWMIEDFRSPARFSTDPRTPVVAASRADHLCTPLYLAPPTNGEKELPIWAKNICRCGNVILPNQHAACVACVAKLMKQDEAVCSFKGEHEDSACPHCNPCRHTEKLLAAEAAMRNLASAVSAGGFNDMNFDPEKFEEKIRDGIDTLIRVERQRATDAAAQLLRDGSYLAQTSGGVAGRDEELVEWVGKVEEFLRLNGPTVRAPRGPKPGDYIVTVACDGFRNKYGITPRDAVEMEWDGKRWWWENEDGVEDFTHMVTHWKDAGGNWIAFLDSDAQREQAK